MGTNDIPHGFGCELLCGRQLPVDFVLCLMQLLQLWSDAMDGAGWGDHVERLLYFEGINLTNGDAQTGTYFQCNLLTNLIDDGLG